MKTESVPQKLEILIAEDSLTQSEQLRYILEKYDFHVVAARNGVEALAMARKRKPTMLISDITMPEMDGFELCRNIRSHETLSDLPVILLTSLSDPEDVFKGLKCGADNFITKPYDEQHLIARINYQLANVHLRSHEKAQVSMEVIFAGHRHSITSNRAQILNLLLSTYESAVEKNRELVKARDGLAKQENELREKNYLLDAALQEAKTAVQAKAVFLATMSHEIRTPMNGVIGMTEILRNTELTETQRDYVETIYASGESLLSIINDILDFSKIESGKMQLEHLPFQLRKCIEEVFDLFTPQIRKKELEVAYSIDSHVPETLMGDFGRLRQILINLVGNALKFTSQGEIILHVRPHGENPSKKTLLFSLVDSGIGISAEALPKLFQSFQQEDNSTTRRYGGTGLGLAISKRLVELMGGTIWVESQLSEGSTFYFTAQLPPAPLPGTIDGPFSTSTALQSRAVLLVDDRLNIQRILHRQLTEWGMTVTSVSSGQEALEKIPKQSFDVALIDQSMAGINGVATAKSIREHTQIPLILLASTHGQMEESQTLFVSRVPKPIKRSALFDALYQALNIKTTSTKPVEGGRFDRKLGSQFPLRILLVEDNPINQKVSKLVLTNLGYAPDLAVNGLLAVQAAGEKAYDLVLMDVRMPIMDGTEATRLIRLKTEIVQPYIVALTADALEGDREKFLEIGFDEYMSKPMKLESLQNILRQAAQKIPSSSP